MIEDVQAAVMKRFGTAHPSASVVFREVVWFTCERLLPLIVHSDEQIQSYAIDVLNAVITSAAAHEINNDVRACLPEMRDVLVYVSKLTSLERKGPRHIAK